MTWSGRDEGVACCQGMGAVGSGEQVTRILVKRTAEPLFYTWFARRDLFPTPDFSNNCGVQDGLSVDRSTNLTDLQITARSAARAAKGNNRISNGGVEAKVELVRSVMQIEQQVPAFRVYDDPIDGNPEHAVIRGCEEIPEEDRATVMGELESLFVNPRGDFKGH